MIWRHSLEAEVWNPPDSAKISHSSGREKKKKKASNSGISLEKQQQHLLQTSEQSTLNQQYK